MSIGLPLEAGNVVVVGRLYVVVQVFAQENILTEEKFIPHASTFLNQQRYLDFLDKPIKNKNLNNLAG